MGACGSEVEIVLPPACSAISGAGHWGPHNAEGGNLNDKLNTSLTGRPELGTTTPNGVFKMHISKLTSAECVAITGGKEFRGAGSAYLNMKPGYTMRFAFAQSGGSTYYTLVLEKAGSVIYELNHQKLNSATSEHMS
jgi:hypothetical protein